MKNKPLTPTIAERATLRAHWPHYELRFTTGGELHARRPGHSWAVLLNARELQIRLQSMRQKD